jgi:hypothetical protein
MNHFVDLEINGAHMWTYCWLSGAGVILLNKSYMSENVVQYFCPRQIIFV